jgi:hypothetical protein
MIENKAVYNVTVKSTVKNRLTDSELTKLFNLEYKLISKESSANYNTLDLLQIDIVNDITTKFFKNLKYELEDDLITIYTNFTLEVPEEFSKEDVADWVGGFRKLKIAYILNTFKSLDISENVLKFIEELEYDQSIDIH